MRRRYIKTVFVLTIAALGVAAAGVMALTRGELVRGATDTVVRIGSGDVVPGDRTTVPLEALAVPQPGLAAVTVDIAFDPHVVTPSEWSAGPNYDSVLCNLLWTADSVRCTAISARGVSGDSLLASVTFDTVGSSGQCSALEIEVATFADPSGNPLPVSPQDGQVCISDEPSSVSPSPAPASPTPEAAATPLGPSDASATASATGPSSPERLALVGGCNPVASTYADNTPIETIRDAVSPSGILMSIWWFDVSVPDWRGYSSPFPEISDLTEVNRLDAIFICVASAGTWIRPEV